MEYKRNKVLPSKTEAIKLECGNLNLIMAFQEEVDGKIVEIRPVIGKSGVCGQVLLDSFGKAVSMLLQSPMPRYKIVEKMKKQYVGVTCSMGNVCCVDIIAKRVIEQLEGQMREKDLENMVLSGLGKVMQIISIVLMVITLFFDHIARGMPLSYWNFGWLQSLGIALCLMSFAFSLWLDQFLNAIKDMLE